MKPSSIMYLSLSSTIVSADSTYFVANAPTASITCDGTTFAPSTVKEAVATAGPMAMFAQGDYPHQYGNIEGISWPATCTEGSLGRKPFIEYPQLSSGIWKKSSGSPGRVRAVYKLADTLPPDYYLAVFCGLMIHPPGSNSFQACSAAKPAPALHADAGDQNVLGGKNENAEENDGSYEL